MNILIIPLMIIIFSFLAYRKWSPILLAPFVTLLTCILAGLPLLDTMLNVYLPGVAGFISNNFFVFFLGSLFGGVMELSGAAKSIATFMSKITRGKFSIPLLMTITGVLAYGGVSGFVVYFTVYPIALFLCKESNISRALIPGAISAGCWTWAMSMPGSPSIPNVLPIKYLNTSPLSDPVPGFLFAGLLLYIMVFVYLEWQVRRYKRKGLVFVEDEHVKEVMDKIQNNNLPNVFLSFIPLILILILFNIIKLEIETSLFFGVITGFLMFIKYGKSGENWLNTFNESSKNSAMIIVNTSVVIGFASVIKETDAFNNLISYLGTLNMNPLIYIAVTVSLSAAAAASASGGIGVALTTFGETYASMGVPSEIVHRISTVACGTLDSLPHTGGQISLLNICHQTHKEAYIHMFITCTVLPMISVLGIIIWHMIFGY